MKKNRIRRFSVILLTVLLFLLTALPISADRGLPVLQGDVKARLTELFEVTHEARTTSQKYRIGGDTFGVRLFEGGVVVVGISDGDSPAKSAGIEKGDVIRAADGHEIHTVEGLVRAIDATAGTPLSLTLVRDGEERTVTLTPRRDDDGRYRIGVRIRDNAAGIGTLTYADPTTGAFGGLGHGICDGESGELLPLSRGAVLSAEISEIVRGTEGTPGELRGTLGNEKLGTVLKNSDKGIFGVLLQTPTSGELVELGARADVHAGTAFLRCSLGDTCTKDYQIELSDVKQENRGTKCFSVHVTDPDLIARTGGIVQGMSGSPILQDGKLIGALTHVLINDPTTGYGIFIQNMLDAAAG